MSHQQVKRSMTLFAKEVDVRSVSLKVSHATVGDSAVRRVTRIKASEEKK